MTKKIYLVIEISTGRIVRRFANIPPAYRYMDKLGVGYKLDYDRT